MNPTAIYSKSGKGVQEASGKTSLLARADRAVLAAFDGRATLGEVAQKCGKAFDAAFEQTVNKLDRDGFIREVVTAGASAGMPPPRPQAKPAAPKPAAPSEPAADLDFSALSIPASKPAAPAAPPPPKPDPRAAAEAERQAQQQASTLAKARQEAEARAQKERDRMKAETEAKLRAEMEAKLRAEAAAKGQADLEAKMRAESEAKVKAAREAAVRAAADAKAKAEAEMKARVEEERKKAEAERKAREEVERKAKEEAERVRKEAEEKARREAEELKKRLEEERARAEAERKAREEAERKAKEEAERARKEAEEKARAEAEALRKQLEEERRKLEEERKARAEEDERRKRAEEENERKRRAEEQERERRASEEAEAKRVAQEKASAAAAAAAAETNPRGVTVPPPASAAPAESFDDNLLADLESFDKRDEDEHKAKEDAERQARADADRKARDQREQDEERRRRAEEADRKARQAAEQAQREEQARRARDEEARKDQERRASELLAGAARGAKAPAEEDDIGVSDDDLDMDDVKQDERVLSATAKRQAREREAAKAEAAAPVSARRPIKWGKLVGTTIAALVIGGLAWLHLMPLPVGDYEKAAASALGRPVKIGSARFSLLTGVQIRFQNVQIGSDVKLASVRGAPQASALFGGRKAFNRIDVEGVTMPESAVGDVLFGKHKSETFTVRRLVAHDLKLGAPLVLPPLDADFTFADDGALQTAVLNGPEGLLTHLTPKGSDVEFDMTAARFALPMAPDISLNQFAMKGTASARGMKIESWDGALFDGRFAGAADLRWGANWEIQGPITVRGVNAAVFAPALLSEGKADGSGRYAMSGSHPEKLMDAAHVEGNFTITKGTLGNIDLSRAIQTAGRQWSGRTQFNEMNGQGVYEKGSVALRNLTIAAGAMNAGASVDVAQNGALSGRIVADVKTASQTLRATLNLGGTVKEPQVRN